MSTRIFLGYGKWYFYMPYRTLVQSGLMYKAPLIWWSNEIFIPIGAKVMGVQIFGAPDPQILKWSQLNDTGVILKVFERWLQKGILFNCEPILRGSAAPKCGQNSAILSNSGNLTTFETSPWPTYVTILCFDFIIYYIVTIYKIKVVIYTIL